MRNVFSRLATERLADTVIVDKGCISVNDVYAGLVTHAVNHGEVDYDALVAGTPQPAPVNADGSFTMYRVGDAWAGRDIHAAMLDSNRLCRVL